MEVVGVLASLGVTIDNVHIVLIRSDSSTAADTVVDVPAGADSVVLDVGVAMEGSSEVFNAEIDLRSGTLVLFSGTQKIVAVAGSGGTTPPADVPMTFSGPGAGAATMVVSPKGNAVRSVDSLQFSATAATAAGADLPNLLVEWTVKDAAIGGVSAAGKFGAANADVRGNTWVIGTLPTGLKDSALVFVIPRATQLLTISGGGQSGTVGATLVTPFVVEARAADNLPVPGVTVNFGAVSGGGAVLPGSVVTSEGPTGAGQASTTLVLGNAPGTNTYSALVTGITPITITAAGIAIPASVSATVATMVSDTIDATLAAANTPAVIVKDASNNPVPGVAVKFRRRGGAGSLLNGLTDTVVTINTGADGIAAIGTRKLQTASGFDTVLVTAGALSDTIRFVAAVQNGLPHHLVYIAQPNNSAAGADISTLLALQDRLNNAVVSGPGSSTTAVTVALSPGTGDTTATLTAGTASALTTTSVNGIVTFVVRVNKAANGYQLVASATGLAPVASAAFNITGGVPTGLAYSNPLAAVMLDTIEANVEPAKLPAVVVRDANSNPVPDVQVTFRRRGGAGGLMNGLPDTVITVATNAQGVAALASRRLQTAIGVDSVIVTAAGLSDTLPFLTAVLGGNPTHMVFSAQPANTALGEPIGLAVTVLDRLENLSTDTSGTRTLTLAIKPGTGAAGAVLSAVPPLTLVADATAGVAAFLASVDKVATGYVLTVTPNFAVPVIESDAFEVTVGAPALIQVVQGEGQGVLKGGVLPDSLVAVLKDAGGNPIPGYGLGRAINGGGSAGGSLTTDASGRVAQQWTAGASGVQTLELTASGGAPSVTFHAFLAETLEVVTQPTINPINGVAFATQPKVQIQDKLGNPVKLQGILIEVARRLDPALQDKISVLSGAQNINSDGNGEVQFTDLAITGQAPQTVKLRFKAVSTPAFDSTYSHTMTLQPGAATQLRFSNQPLGTSTDVAFTVAVQALDASSNGPVTGYTGAVTLAIANGPSGTAALSGTTTVNAVAGVATFSVSVNEAGTYELTATASGLSAPSNAVPFDAAAPMPVIDISASPYTNTESVGSSTCARTYEFPVAHCWGGNALSTIGRDPFVGGDCVDINGKEQCVKPIAVSLLASVSQVVTGSGFACGIIQDGGEALCWGRGPGNPGRVESPQPTSLPGTVRNFSMLAAGESHACGITPGLEGVLYCWGFNGFGNLGIGNTSGMDEPTAVSGERSGTWSWVSANAANTCGVAGGALYCWGSNEFGQLGDSTYKEALDSTPRAVSIGVEDAFTKVSVGLTHVCAIRTDEKLLCWGGNAWGQLGDESTDPREAPTLIAGTQTWTAIAAGPNHTCGISSGRMYCWGGNDFGQLGDGTTNAQTKPAQIRPDLAWTSVSVGLHYSCGVANNIGYCWGSNENGQLGSGDDSSKLDVSLVPIPVVGAGMTGELRPPPAAPNAKN